MKRYDAIVIGAGASGLFTAYWLTKLGMKDVLILDKWYVSSGATGRCVGGIRAQFSNPPDIRLALESQRLYERLGTDVGFDPLFRQGGYLFLAFDDEQMEGFRQNSKVQNENGVFSRIVGREEMRKLCPALNTDSVVGGCFNPKDGVALHFAVAWGLAEKARKQGATILPCTTAEEIETAGGSVTGVRTSNAHFATDHVVCAAGIDSVELLQPLGLHLPLRPMKREVLVTEPVRAFFDPMVVSFVGDAIAQTLRGEVVAENAEGEEEMDTRSWSSSFSFTEMCARKLLRLFPCLADVRIARQWAGSYDMSPDHRPILQAFSSPRGLALAAGYSGHGFMLGPMVGKIMAKLVLEGQSDFDITTFRLERFGGSELAVETTVI